MAILEHLRNWLHRSGTIFIAEDEKTLVKDPLESSNTLLVDGVTRRFSSGLKILSKDILPTSFTNLVAL